MGRAEYWAVAQPHAAPRRAGVQHSVAARGALSWPVRQDGPSPAGPRDALSRAGRLELPGAPSLLAALQGEPQERLRRRAVRLFQVGHVRPQQNRRKE